MKSRPFLWNKFNGVDTRGINWTRFYQAPTAHRTRNNIAESVEKDTDIIRAQAYKTFILIIQRERPCIFHHSASNYSKLQTAQPIKEFKCQVLEDEKSQRWFEKTRFKSSFENLFQFIKYTDQLLIG